MRIYRIELCLAQNVCEVLNSETKYRSILTPFGSTFGTKTNDVRVTLFGQNNFCDIGHSIVDWQPLLLSTLGGQYGSSVQSANCCVLQAIAQKKTK